MQFCRVLIAPANFNRYVIMNKFLVQKFLYVLILLSPCICNAEILKVGVISAFSGPAAANGIAIQNSIELARKDKPESFSNIEFIYEDAGYDSARAVAAYSKLKNIDGVKLFYIWGVSFCNPIAPLANEDNVLIICQGIEQKNYNKTKNIVRFMNVTDDYAITLLSYFRAKGWKKIGIVITDHLYPEGIYESLIRNLKKGEEVIVVDRYPTGFADMSTTVTKLARSKFDAIGVFLTPGQIGQFYKRLAQQNVSTPTFGTNYFENYDEIKLGGITMNGAIYVHNLVSSKYIERYQMIFGNQSQLAFGGMAYEFASLVGDTFNIEGNNLSSNEMQEKLKKIKYREGKVMGIFGYTETEIGGKYFNFPIAIKMVKDGGSVVIKD